MMMERQKRQRLETADKLEKYMINKKIYSFYLHWGFSLTIDRFRLRMRTSKKS